MQELIAQANQAILEAQSLCREGRLLRYEASLLANRLSQTVVQSRHTEKEASELKVSLDQAFSRP
jgi:hypothetical protein